MSGSDLENIPLSSDTEPGEVHDAEEAVNTAQVSNTGDQYKTQHSLSWDGEELNPEDEEERHRLIQQVLELQNTLDDLSTRVDSVKEENMKLKSENQVLGQYIENLMTASNVFQSTEPKPKRK